jgi:hypothetical protein
MCAGLFLGANAFAAETNPCTDDIGKFCPTVKPGAETIQCLEMHENGLTDACRAYEAKLHGKRGEMKEQVQEQKTFRAACGNDMVKFCNDADPADGGIVKCLDSHGKDLSGSCADNLKAMKKEKE